MPFADLTEMVPMQYNLETMLASAGIVLDTAGVVCRAVTVQ